MLKKMKFVGMVCLLSGLMQTTIAQGAEIILPATIRDFQSSHPDFENGVIASDTGYVDLMIGADGKPVYTGGAGTTTTSGAANYDQWYNDVPGVNLSTAFDLILDNGMPGPGGLYEFSSTSFFPIDGMLFGNEGHVHNFHFTMELHSQFQYQAGLTFEVTADDDLLVFIDGKLAIDLGGVHPPQSATLDLDTLGLVDGQTYDFDLFFAERNTNISNLSIKTNIQFVPEPATLAMLGIGLFFWAVRRQMR